MAYEISRKRTPMAVKEDMVDLKAKILKIKENLK